MGTTTATVAVTEAAERLTTAPDYRLLATFHRATYAGEITQADGRFHLSWTDGVANEWSESFTSAAVASARLDALDAAVDADECFTDGPEAFEAAYLAAAPA